MRLFDSTSNFAEYLLKKTFVAPASALNEGNELSRRVGGCRITICKNNVDFTSRFYVTIYDNLIRAS